MEVLLRNLHIIWDQCGVLKTGGQIFDCCGQRLECWNSQVLQQWTNPHYVKMVWHRTTFALGLTFHLSMSVVNFRVHKASNQHET